jgi:peptidoglycan/xylan/chitin deacetylase (PgdA/CDA1 family)
VLDILKSFNVKATFFILGENARVFPDAVRRAAGEGHEIGNHGCDHSVLPLKSPGRIRKEIRTTNDLIEGIAGVRPKLFRASHGWRNPWVNKAARENGCLPVAWTHGVWDTDMPGSGVIAARASKGLRNGCVLLLHDGRGTEHGVNTSQLIEALPTIIELACQSGYGFVTVSEMMKGTCT